MATKKADNNMRIWSQVDRTDPSATKAVSFGRKFTAIDAQYQRKRATEVFGPIGQGYGLADVCITYMDFGERGKLANYQAQFWWSDDDKKPVNRYPVGSSIKVIDEKGRVDDEWLKKVSTDALTKGLSMLGFNSDVFEGKFDDNRYVAAMTEEFKTGDKSTVVQDDRPDSLETYQSIFEKAAEEGGTPAFRALWSDWARDDLGGEEAAKCKAYVKGSALSSEWLQGKLKAIAKKADERLEAQNAAQ